MPHRRRPHCIACGALCLAAILFLCLMGLNAGPETPPLLSVASTIALRHGVQMPQMGMGMGGRLKEEWHGGGAVAAANDAISVGIRHLDTAQVYGTEDDVGQVVRTCGVPRDAMWVTSKLNNWHVCTMSFNETIASLNTSLTQHLGLTHVDLFLLHAPPCGHVIESWRALLHARDALGLTRAVGVSNWNVARLEALSHAGYELPQVVQVEVHPWLPQHGLVDYCHAHGIAVEAYGPLGPSARWHDARLGVIADAHGKLPQQVLLRWLLQRGIVPIFGTHSPKHLRSDVDLYDFELTADDMREITQWGANKSAREYVFHSSQWADDDVASCLERLGCAPLLGVP